MVNLMQIFFVLTKNMRLHWVETGNLTFEVRVDMPYQTTGSTSNRAATADPKDSTIEYFRPAV